MASYKPVNAVMRALDIMVTINRLKGKASVGELHRHTGLDKATITRMLETLEYTGFLVRDDQDRTYQVTGKTLQLSSGYDKYSSIGTIVAPILTDFRKTIGWPSDIALFDYDSMIVVETSREAGPLNFNRKPGYRAPLLATSIGLAYLAHCDERERQSALKRAAADPAQWNDLARDERQAYALFERIREQGYATMDPAYSNNEYAGNVSSLGVPVMKYDKVFAAVNIIYLQKALSPEEAVRTLLEPLKEAASKMADALSQRWTT